MGNILSPFCFIAPAVVGVAFGAPLGQAALSKRGDGNVQVDISKRIVTGLLLALAALLALYLYLTWKRREPARPTFLFVLPQPLNAGGAPPMAVPSRHRTPPQLMSMGFAASSSSSGPALHSPPIQIPGKVVKARSKTNAPAVGDHYVVE